MSALMTGPPPSGAHLAPPCDRKVCDGWRTYLTPAGPSGRHCGCPTGRRLAELDYAEKHGRTAALTPDELPRGVS